MDTEWKPVSDDTDLFEGSSCAGFFLANLHKAMICYNRFMAENISIALIGLGRIGRLHAENLAAHPKFSLACVYDIDADTAAAVAQEYNTTAACAADDIFADPAIAAVFIASATATHCDFIEQAVNADKAVLCEKPLDLDPARVRRTADKIAAKPQAVVQIGFNRRFDPGHATLIARTRAGEIGAVEKLLITSRDPAPPPPAYLAASGGLFHDMMIHDFDMARAVLDEEPTAVCAAGSALVAPETCAVANDVDTAMALLQTAGGTLCHINCSRRAVYGYDQRVEVFGSDGMLISDNRTATQVQAYGAHYSGRREPLLHFFTDRYGESYRLQLDAFAAAVHGEAEAQPSFTDGARALFLADAARKSLINGGWVTPQAT